VPTTLHTIAMNQEQNHSINQEREKRKNWLLTNFFTNGFESLCGTETIVLERERKGDQHLRTLIDLSSTREKEKQVESDSIERCIG